jgi:hypothetical protein
MAKVRKKTRKGTHGRHVWGVGPLYDSFAVVGMTVCGVLPKKNALSRAFDSGHAESENGSAKLVRPSALAYKVAQEIAGNPEKYRKVLSKIGLADHLIGE